MRCVTVYCLLPTATKLKLITFSRSSWRRVHGPRGFLVPLIELSVRKSGFPRYSKMLEWLNWNLHLYERNRPYSHVPTFATKKDLYDHLNARFDEGRQAMDYFEFGVFQGESLRAWCELNRDPKSRIFGFDSFLGLPEDWQGDFRRGTFTTGGLPPPVNDPRVNFVIGFFQQTLPQFLSSYEPRNTLLIHCDSDLYSSTLFCLATMDHLMLAGTLVIFDEFNDASNEYRALVDYCSAYMRDYRVVAGTRHFAQAAVEII